MSAKALADSSRKAIGLFDASVDSRDGVLAAPQRFAVQFTATQEYVDLVACAGAEEKKRAAFD